MEVTVYADLLFLINAGMDGLCFYLTGRLLHRKLAAWRVFTGTLIGGLYAVLALLPDMGQATAFFCDAGVCLVICAIVLADRKQRPKQFFLSVAVYFVLSMVLGGVMTALYHLFNRMGFTDYLPVGEDGPGAWLFALLAFLSSGITLWSGGIFRRSAAVEHCHVTVEIDGRRAEIDGMVDTGNQLRDPLSGRAVICVDETPLKNILPSILAEDFRRSDRVTSLSSSADARRLRLIPASSATGEDLLRGFIPDKVEIAYAVKGKMVHRQVDVVIAITKLEHTRVLVPSELIN